MSGTTRRVATATSIMLVAALGVIGSPGAAVADAESECVGMSAPANTRVLNQAPVLTNDTVKALSGTVVPIRVLANDTDPDGDKLYVTSTSNPGRGETCIGSNGVVEYYAARSATNYTQVINYGVTDGDLYRTARITVNVEGIPPVRPVLKKRLLLKKGSKAVKRRAVVTFTNPGKRTVILAAGDPDKERPGIECYVRAGQTVRLKTKAREILYVTGLQTADGEFHVVSLGMLKTRNGAQEALLRKGASAATDHEAVARRWLQK